MQNMGFWITGRAEMGGGEAGQEGGGGGGLFQRCEGLVIGCRGYR